MITPKIFFTAWIFTLILCLVNFYLILDNQIEMKAMDERLKQIEELIYDKKEK